MTKRFRQVLAMLLAGFMLFQLTGLGTVKAEAADDYRTTVYVYVLVKDQNNQNLTQAQGAALGLQLNHSGYYTVGKITGVDGLNCPNPTSKAVAALGRTDRYAVNGTVVNQYVDIAAVQDWELKWCNQGADNYLPGGNCWHLDGILTTNTLRTYQVNYLESGTDNVVATAKVGSGTLGVSVTESPISITGYTPVSTASATITLGNDSSQNVINFYYTVNKYNVTYDLDGGTTTSETTTFKDVPYGTQTPKIADPSKGTDRFMGWTPSVSETVTDNATYTAQWAPTYTINYYDNNAQLTGMDSNRYITGEKATVLACAAEHDHKDGRHIVGWSTEHNGTLMYNQKSKLEAFMATSSYVPIGSEMTFGNQNIDLYAVWASDKITETYTVTYDLAGGTSTSTQLTYRNLEHGATTPTIVQPTKAGYTFAGWDKEIAATVTANVTYTAQWTPNTVNYTVKYYYQTNGQYGTADSSDATRTAKTGDSVSVTDDDKKPAADKSGYVLDRSETAAAAWSGSIPVEGTLVLKVYFKQQFVVTYDLAGGTTTSDQLIYSNLDHGTSTPTIAEPTKAGYTFDGWNTSGGTVANNVTADATYTAQWTPNTVNYTVEYYYQTNGQYGTAVSSDATRTAATGESVSVTDNDKNPAADKTGYVLDGSETAAAAWSGSIPSEGRLVLKVYFKQQFTVEYVGGEHGTVGEGAKTENLDYAAAMPTAPKVDAAEGYTFTGWDKEIAKTVTENVVYTAQYTINSYTVTYKVDGEVVGEVETYDYNKEVVLREKIVKVGYTVSDWSISDKTFNMPAKDLEITATTTINSYTVTYMLDGEQYGEVETHEYGETVLYRAAIEKEGYTFSGWTMGRALSFEMPAENVIITGTLIKNEIPEVPEESKDPEESEESKEPEESENTEESKDPEESVNTEESNNTEESVNTENSANTENSQITPPVQPQQPEQEVQGAVVDKPVETPSTPASSTTATATRPDTGDHTQTAVWIILLVVSLIGAVAIVIVQRRKER